jgi:cell division septum initiation protein DivIVA
MPRGKTTEDLSTLQMALVGYQVEKERVEAKIQELQAKLKGKTVFMPATNPAGGKRILSPAARKRIATAQKKRWAEHRKRVAQEAKEA